MHKMDIKYDVIIIGAGIGGLTCGCYLAKAGLKVLIVEQHSRPGGYCSSFERQGYRFDVGVHYLGGMKNILKKIFSELEVSDEIQFNRFDPTDKIIMPDNIAYIYANPQHTIEEFIENFPKEEENIKSFFQFITQKNFFNIYKKIKIMSFQEVLDNFFEDFRLKATIEALLLNFGLSAKKASAITSIFLYRDYILDGGYYPRSGMQGFADGLVTVFNRYGGELILNKKVVRILVLGKKVRGIILDEGKVLKTDFVVSNADATQTFNKLISDTKCRENILVDKLICSPSLFAMYIGTNKDLKTITNETCNIWNFDSYEIDRYISHLKDGLTNPNLPFVMTSFPSSHASNLRNINKNTIQFFLIAPFNSKEFWEKNKNEIAIKILKRTKNIFPNLEKYINVKIIATPFTFYKYTLNKKGAAFGWASTVNQTRSTLFPKKSSLENLFLVGHWTTIGSGQGGVPKVILSGRKGAHLILDKINKKI